ncbi:tetracycline resistance protein from transposon, partial [Cercophora newfieldiana]
PKIAIIGAGPVGCTLARLLHLASLPVTVFEAEASPNYRSQGGTLDLHTSTGLAALKAAELFKTFLSHARYDGHHIQFTDRRLKSYLTLVGPAVPKEGAPRSKLEEQRPEIDRSDLRRLLAESLPEGVIRWGWKVESVTPSEDGDPLETKGFALVVGADGAFSRTRTAVSGEKPVFSRVGLWELSVPDAERTAPEVKAAVKGGSIFAHAKGRRISVQQMGDGSLSVGVVQAQEDEDWARREKCGYDAGDLEAVKDRLLEGEGALFGEDWHPLVREALRKCEGRCIPRSLWQMPVGFRWEHCEGITLVGDAAHVMTPFAGEGVNVGMNDAMNLAKEVVQALRKEGGWTREALDAAVRDYELEMWPRSEKVARLSDELAKLYMFEPNTPESIIARTTALHVKVAVPRVVHPLVDAAVHGVFFF